MKLLSTGELATLFSLSKYTIRHYIEIELLIPHQRNKNGYYFLMKKIFIDSTRLSSLEILDILSTKSNVY